MSRDSLYGVIKGQGIKEDQGLGENQSEKPWGGEISIYTGGSRMQDVLGKVGKRP